jgi:site-specific DNA-methyltransferase (adenine-specific)
VKPYYEHSGITIYHGDCREFSDLVDVVIADPPYETTSLEWDRRVESWCGEWSNNLWLFGSLRSLMNSVDELARSGWQLAQDLVWEKHNGSNFHADRFRRVHEHIAQFYRGSWESLYRSVPKTMDATKRAVRRKQRPTHTGHIEAGSYESQDGGPRIMRSVLRVRSEHGRAFHPTQKPVAIVNPLIEYSCPPGGMVLDPFMGSDLGSGNESRSTSHRHRNRRTLLRNRGETTIPRNSLAHSVTQPLSTSTARLLNSHS